MRTYEVETESLIQRIYADNVDLGENFFKSTDLGKSLVFQKNGRILAILREWNSVIDITEDEGVKNEMV